MALFALPGAIGCGNGSPSAPAIASTPMAGKIGGRPWSLGTGETDSVLSTSSSFYVETFSDSFSACSGSSVQRDYFFATFSLTAGDYSLDVENFTANFSLEGTQTPAATIGHLVIASVTASTVTGGLNIT